MESQSSSSSINDLLLQTVLLFVCRHGQSNPTYLLTSNSGQTCVLRKKPPGDLLHKAHKVVYWWACLLFFSVLHLFHLILQVDREYRMISALHRVGFPVPCPLLYCDDANIIGTPFYLMEYVKVYTSHSNPIIRTFSLHGIIYIIISNR